MSHVSGFERDAGLKYVAASHHKVIHIVGKDLQPYRENGYCCLCYQTIRFYFLLIYLSLKMHHVI